MTAPETPPDADVVGDRRALAWYVTDRDRLLRVVEMLTAGQTAAEAERDRLVDDLSAFTRQAGALRTKSGELVGKVNELAATATAVAAENERLTDERDRLAERVQRVSDWLAAMDEERNTQYYAAHVAAAGRLKLDGPA